MGIERRRKSQALKPAIMALDERALTSGGLNDQLGHLRASPAANVSAATAQTLRVFQAEDPKVNDWNTGRRYTDGPISGIYAGNVSSAYHPPGLIGRIKSISGLPANTDLAAKFRLWKVSTVYGTNNVAIEVFSATQNKTLAQRVLKNDNSLGYQDHHLNFRVKPGEVVELRVYWYSSRGSQVKYDQASIERVR